MSLQSAHLPHSCNQEVLIELEPVDLRVHDPVTLVDRHDVFELMLAIQHIQEWDATSLAAADLLITCWSSQAIARPKDREEIEQLQRVIDYAINHSSALLPQEYVSRWKGCYSILEIRRLQLWWS